MISGPVATMMLADQGADVIKVEPLAGDLVRQMGPNRGGLTATFISSNRSKRSLAIDLKTREGMALLERLIPDRRRVRAELPPRRDRAHGTRRGAACARCAPTSCTCRSAASARRGPYAHKRVYDPVIQALSGLAAIQADRDTGRPTHDPHDHPRQDDRGHRRAGDHGGAVRARAHGPRPAREARHARHDGRVPVARGDDGAHVPGRGGEVRARAARAGPDLRDTGRFHHRGRRSPTTSGRACAARSSARAWLADERFDTRERPARARGRAAAR